MFKRAFAPLIALSAVLAMTSSPATAPLPNLPKGSTVFISPMEGFDTYFRAATRTGKLPLVFVRTRAEADYEITGHTRGTTADENGRGDDQTTTRQQTTIRITNIESGQIVFAHSVDTRVHSQANRPGRKVVAPAQFIHLGKQTAARACVAALQEALNATP
jgi:hypothetical protein